MADEKMIRMAAKLYVMRETAQRLLGAHYAAKMAELGGVLKTVAEKTQREPLASALTRRTRAVRRTFGTTARGARCCRPSPT